jgi:hypothetical protein
LTEERFDDDGPEADDVSQRADFDFLEDVVE